MKIEDEQANSKACDWTDQLPQTDHVRFIRSIDWSQSGLGPLKDWNSNLRLFTGFALADSRAACLWWGPDSIAIYNEHFVPLCAGIHPTLMGSTYAQSLPEIWPYIKTLFEESRRTGTGQNISSAAPLLVVARKSGRLKLRYVSSNSVYEVTQQKLTDRRTSMMNKLAAVPSQNVDDVLVHVLATMETNPNDIPFAMLYKFKEGLEPSVLQSRGQIGLPKGHEFLIQSAHFETCDQGLIPDMRRAGSENVVFDYDHRFEGISWKGWGSPSKKFSHIAH
ncbi:hypothetical protein IAQ61_004233 [Plenodomus lingam]|uniref:uncharacterized protein n=1 Tax=Leptosphaeria maculans TaxID=5022 RepID=UPI00332E90B1|nr:hypothetical protein IAQ61_004233 [Plenodomus lingam]